MKTVYRFEEMSQGLLEQAGGKGSNLAKLHKLGLPVPDGFVIIPSGFSEDGLSEEAWNEVKTYLEGMRQKNKHIRFAVRSSALSEDSEDASFAGEFESVLEVASDDEVNKAIHHVYDSRRSERVKTYSQTKQIEDDHQMAVVVQKLIHADKAGVLFSADPITGNRSKMVGNYVEGLGESLVSGEANAESFELALPKGTYHGPNEMKKYGKQLYKLASRIDAYFGLPQDIEWALYNNKIYILQSRPITTLIGHNREKGEWNDSKTGAFLWAVDCGGIYPEVVTPSTWSLIQQTFQKFSISGVTAFGNIGGRIYVNCSLQYSLLKKVGWKHDRIITYLNDVMTSIPLDLEVPTIPISTKEILKSLFVRGIERSKRAKKVAELGVNIVSHVPNRCDALIKCIHTAQDKKTLMALWNDEIYPLFLETFFYQSASNKNYIDAYVSIKKDLLRAVGEDLTNKLLTSANTEDSGLSSTEIYFGALKVISGEMSKEAYEHIAGHRTINENELAAPRPYEDPDWIDKRVKVINENSVSITRKPTDKRDEVYKEAKNLIKAMIPKQYPKIERKLSVLLSAMTIREAIRSEVTRCIGVARQFYLKVGDILGIGADVFFLSYEDIVELFEGKREALAFIPLRKATYNKYRELPTYPAVIKGRFDPFLWAKDKKRRSDIFAEDYQIDITYEDKNVIKGRAGSSGIIEGIVRRIDKPEEGIMLQEGEILVTATTNVGWTPIFSKASAVITDIGAPLAHAAIIAREMGIPAVVGCGNASTRLKTGDKVVVDGGKGMVWIVE